MNLRKDCWCKICKSSRNDALVPQACLLNNQKPHWAQAWASPENCCKAKPGLGLGMEPLVV